MRPCLDAGFLLTLFRYCCEETEGLMSSKGGDMKKLLLLTALACGFAQAFGAELKVGDPAPDFSLQGSDGKMYKLSDFKGKKPVVVAWFPKAFTGGCTAECKSMKENSAALHKYDAAYFTASVDDPEKNKKFGESLGLDYPILSDPTKETAKAYGVVHPGREVAERWTFYIDKEGKIAAIDKTVKTTEHGKDIAAKLKEMGVPERKG
jgi:peroxiredoxin Q/BCP